ncbi:MAG: hypothetical protein H7Y32_20170, partial [Chloroflexales bacterium]|nr:hypothetical protein [Chloroflexales bacterium]
MEILDREKIIALGKLLRQESEAGCANTVADGGLDAYLAQWHAEANGAMGYEAVRQTLALLADYDVQPLNARREMLARSLAALRALFKNGAQAQSPEHKTQSADGGAETADGQPALKRRTPRPESSPQSSVLSTGPATRVAPTTPAIPTKPLTLDSPIADVPGIGKANATSFKRLSLHTVRD